MKRLWFAVSLVLTAFSITGCIDTQVEFQFKGDGSYDSQVFFTADELFGGDAVDVYVWQIMYIFPELSSRYLHTSEGSVDLGYVRHHFWGEDLDVSVFNRSDYVMFQKRDDGSFLFESTIPSLLDTVAREFENDVVLVVKIRMPKPILIANTPAATDSTATWRITHGMLVSGATLKAITE